MEVRCIINPKLGTIMLLLDNADEDEVLANARDIATAIREYAPSMDCHDEDFLEIADAIAAEITGHE